MFHHLKTRPIETARRFVETRENISRLTGRPREIAEAFLDRLRNRDALDFSLPEKTLDTLLLAPGEIDFAGMFHEGSDERLALEAMVGAENAALAKSLWDARPSYPLPYVGRWRPGSDFFANWNRCRKMYSRQPPYHGPASRELHFRPALHVLLAHTAALIHGFELHERLAGNAPDSEFMANEATDCLPPPFWEDEGDYVPPLIATLLDRRDENSEKLLAVLRSRLAGEASPILTRQILSGLLKSGRDEAHAVAEAILAGAGIRAGTRSTLPRFEDDDALAVVEAMVRGGRAAFRRLLRVIVDKALFRVPDVGEAFLTWTGLVDGPFMWADLDDEFSMGMDLDAMGIGNFAWIGDALAHAERCLSDGEYRRSAVNGETALEAFLALWAAGVENIGDAERECRELLGQQVPRHQRLAAVALGASISHPARRFRLLAPLLGDPAVSADRELVAWAANNLPQNLLEQDCRHTDGLPYQNIFQAVENPEVESRTRPGDFIYLTPNEIGRYYLELKALALQFADEREHADFDDSLLPGFPIGYGRTALFELMLQPLVRGTAWTGRKPRHPFSAIFRAITPSPGFWPGGGSRTRSSTRCSSRRSPISWTVFTWRGTSRNR